MESEPTPTCYLLNADFDLGLRGDPLPSGPARRRIASVEMLALAGSSSGCVALLSAAPDPSFTAYARDQGLGDLCWTFVESRDRTFRFEPFAWDARSAALNAEHRVPAGHASLDLVRRLNGRSYVCGLQEALGDAWPAQLFEDPIVLEKFLGTSDRTWMLKGEYGNAGLANRPVRAPLTAADRRFVTDQLSVGPLTCEHFHERACDIAYRFNLTRGGEIEELNIYQTISTSSGGLIGGIFAADSPSLEQQQSIVTAARHLAQHLHTAGYFGAVCCDAYYHRVPGSKAALSLRPLVDLNARGSVADSPYRLYRRLFRDRVFYWRFLNPARVRLPRAQRSFVGSLGDLHYQPASRRGVLLLAPLHFSIDGTLQPTTKFAVALIGESVDDVMRQEATLRSRWE